MSVVYFVWNEKPKYIVEKSKDVPRLLVVVAGDNALGVEAGSNAIMLHRILIYGYLTS